MQNSTESKEPPVAMILAAGRGTRLYGVTKGSPKALVDVAGTPAILWIIASLLKNGIRDYVIVVSPLAERSMRHLFQRVLSGISIRYDFAVQHEPTGPGRALAVGLQKVQDDRGVLVALCDTLFDEPLSFESDWIGVAEAQGVGAWCWAETDGPDITRLYDKVAPPPGVKDVLIGLYFFRDQSILRDAVHEAFQGPSLKPGETQISWAIERYMASRNMTAHNVATWVDCGTQENWLDANERMFRHRHSHELYLRRDSNGVRVVKDTGDRELLSCEVEWFSQVGQLLPDLVPDVHVSGDTCYESEYLEMNLLSSVYLYQAGGEEVIVDYVMSLLTTLSERLWAHEADITEGELAEACQQMYLLKPMQRLAQWDEWHHIRLFDQLRIDGRTVDNPVQFLTANVLRPYLYRNVARKGWIHGDLHFSNILFDSSSRSFRLIDPRGRFGDIQGPAGDIYYDLAKLRHSYAGMYDAIVAGLFDLKYDLHVGTFELHIGPECRDAVRKLDALIEQLGFDLTHVRLLEIGIFLSLIPLHNENLRRQYAFFVRAFQLLLELLEER